MVKYLDSWKDYIFFLLLATLFGAIVLSSSFLYENWYPLDGTIFHIVGKGWTEGKIPYLDLWDQKGPLTYFINALGYWMTGNKYGLFILEVILLAWTFKLAYSFYRRWFSVSWAILLLCITILHLSQIMESGNTVEEYILPLLMISFFYIWDWTEHSIEVKVDDHSPAYAFLYGLILAASLLTRLTNAIGICLATLVILVILIYHKKWNNLIMNALAFIGGFLLLTIPFIAYYYYNDGLQEMIYATLIFNFDYLNSTIHGPVTLYYVISKLLAYVGTYGLAIVSLLLLIYDRKLRVFHLIWFIISSLTLIYFLKSPMYGHYAVISIPYFAIMLVEFKKLYHLLNEKHIVRYSMKTFIIIIVSVIIGNGAFQIRQTLENRNVTDNTFLCFEKEVLSQVGEDKSALVCYNILPSYYLRYQITPDNRFFALQNKYAS